MLPDKGQTPADPIHCTPRDLCKGSYRVSVEECTWVRLEEYWNNESQCINEQSRINANSNNLLAMHVAGTEHVIRWDEAETKLYAGKDSGPKQKVIYRENLLIKAHASNLNLEAGAFIDTNLKPPS